MAIRPSGTAQRSDARRNFDKIVVAAETLFATEGVEVPFSKVAAQAGVGHGTLYRHFASKHALAVEIYERRLDGYERLVNDHKRDQYVLRDLLRVVAAGQRSIPELFRIIENADQGALGAEPPDPEVVATSAADIVRLRRRTEQIFSLALRRSQKAGGAAPRLKTNDVLIMIAMMLGAANSPLARIDRDDAIQRGLTIIEAALKP